MRESVLYSRTAKNIVVLCHASANSFVQTADGEVTKGTSLSIPDEGITITYGSSDTWNVISTTSRTLTFYYTDRNGSHNVSLTANTTRSFTIMTYAEYCII